MGIFDFLKGGKKAQQTVTMTREELDAIWRRLSAYSFDALDAPMPFSKRLAEKMGWTEDFALQAIEEYRRFLFMARISPTEVTPSQLVDEVWHFHLQYTEDYWVRLCDEVLGAPIHHNPGDGSGSDEERHALQYGYTLELYAHAFGEDAPEEIWPRPKKLAQSKPSAHSPPRIASRDGREEYADDTFWMMAAFIAMDTSSTNDFQSPLYNSEGVASGVDAAGTSVVDSGVSDVGSAGTDAGSTSVDSGAASCGGASSCGSSCGASCGGGGGCGGGGCGGGCGG